MSRVPVRAHVATFARSFAIQGSWNYRTMLGQGFAFALLPVLKHAYRGDAEALERALGRHAGHFNAHPYMAELALGAVARMEVDGADPETIRRFKAAIRGPLGGIGDRLVWAGAVPAAALAGLVVAVGGAPAWLPALLFLGVYNAGHLTLRIWAYRVGLQEGARVAGRLRSAALSRYAGWLASGSTFLLGCLGGMAALRVAEADLGLPAAAAMVVATGAVGVGARLGQAAWRWAAVGVVALVVGGIVLSTFG